MTVINPNSVAGINSITVQSGNSLAVHKANGELIRTLTSSSGVSTFSSISVGAAYTDNSAGKSINIGLGASISQHTDNTLTLGTAGNERLRINATGTVLKGLTTARGNYANNTSGVEYGFQIESTNATKSSLSLIRSSNDVNDGGIFIGKTRSTSVGGNTVVQAGDDLGTITFGGADGTTLQFGATITAQVQSGVGNDDMPTDLIVTTNGGSTSTVERLRITSGGQVGIASATPTSGFTLDVGGDATIGTPKGTGNTYLDQKQDGDLHIINSGRTSNGASGSPGTAGVGINRFNTRAGGTSLFRDFCVYNGKDTKVLVVDGSAASVGIGTDAPDGALTIAKASSVDMLMLNVPGATGTFGKLGHNTASGVSILDMYSEGHTRFLTGGNNERVRITNGGKVIIGNTSGSDPSSTVGGAMFYGGSYPGDFRISSGAGASGTSSGAISIMGSNHNASITHGDNYGAQLNLYNYNTNTGNSSAVSFHNKNGLASARILGLNIDHDNRDGALVFMVADGSHPVEAARIIQNKNLGIQADSNVNNRIEIGGGAHYVTTNSGQARNGIHIRGQAGNAQEFGGGISFSCNPNGGDTGAAAIAAEQMSSDSDIVGLAFFTHETSTGSDNAEQKLRIPHTGGLFMMNQEVNRGYCFDSTSGSRPTEANVQGSSGTGMIAAKKDNIAQNTVTKIGDSHWGGLALVGYSGTGHQGFRLVAYGYGGAGASVLFSGNWVGSLTTTFSMNLYELRVSHNASNALNFWLINIGV